MKNWSRTTWIIIIAAITLVVIAIYYAGRRSSYDTGYIPNDVVIPGGGNLSTPDNQQVQSMVAALYKEIKGLNITYNQKVYTDYNAMSDTLFVATYNLFNKLYQSQGDGTLRDWINSEYTPFWGVVDSINSRFERLNLS